jgi:Mycothiol maleylpyruvate isomerase N-terminal domain
MGETEIAARYRRVARRFSDRTAEMTRAAWESPAPCDGWVARDVVRHLGEWFPAFLAEAGGPVSLPDVAEPLGRACIALNATSIAVGFGPLCGCCRSVR